MTAPPQPKTKLVTLKKAGLKPEHVHAQVNALCDSDFFKIKTNPKELLKVLVDYALKSDTPPTVEEICHALKKPYIPRNALIRGIAKTLRKGLLAAFPPGEVKPGEIQLHVMPRDYRVYTLPPRRVKAISSNKLHGLIGHNDACILQPAEMEEVYREVKVRGRIDALDPDLRVWLVVYINEGHYLQGRVSRKSPQWEQEVKCGIIPWGGAEGQVFTILLVAADTDGDYAMYDYLRANGTGTGMMRLPSDTWELDRRRVVRRDIRGSY